MPSLAPLASTVRDRGRRAVSAVLRRIPDETFAPLRMSLSSTAPASWTHWAQYSLLKVARYRGVPPHLNSFALPDNPSVRIANADSYIVERLYWLGEREGYEPATIHWWRKFCASSSHILEFGSNIGYYMIQGALAAPTAHFTAVEPHPGCAAVCRRNVDLNAIVNVQVVEAAAVADISTPTVELVLPGGRDHYTQAPCTGFIGVNDVHHAAEDRSSYSSITVPAVAVSSLVHADTDLIKMDVEGQEHILISAMLDQLRASHPTIFVELLETTPKLRSLILNELLPTGYRCFVPTMEALVPLSAAEISTISPAKDHGTRDIILTSRSDITAG